MKRTLLTLAILAAASAHAGQPFVGGGGMANNNTGGNAAQAQQQQQAATATSAAAAAAQAAGGNAVVNNAAISQGGAAGAGGQGGSFTVGGAGIGNTTYERSAPSVGAVAPVQVRNCRVGIGFGGSNANGAFTAAIPLGNDATCLAGAALEAMQVAGGFTTAERQAVACTIEGMADMPTCKRIAQERQRAAAPVMMPTVTPAQADAQYTDPIIRRRLGMAPL